MEENDLAKEGFYVKKSDVSSSPIPEELKKSLEKNFGQIKYHRDTEFGRFAVIKERDGWFDSLQIKKVAKGHKVEATKGFPNYEKAFWHMDQQHNKEIEHKLEKSLEKDKGLSR